MRVTTAFFGMLGIEAATVGSVAFTREGIVVGLRRSDLTLRVAGDVQDRQ